MIAILIKELRENLRWALLVGLVLAGAFYYTVHSNQSDSYSFNDGITLCRETFLTATSFGFAAAGLLLGFLQILPELKRDRWAALLHRPVSRGVVFGGKALAGVLLYVFATALPFFAIVWLVATPGHFPTPFVPGMILPGLSDLASGLVYYFAALLIGLQRGGSIFLRALPFFAAFHLSGYAQSCALFRVAVEAAALMALALLVAAWGAIGNQDLLRARPLLCRAAFVGIALYGVLGVGDLIYPLLGSVFPRPREEWSRYELGENGMPLRLTVKDGTVISVENPDGSHPTERDYQLDRVNNHTNSPSTVSQYIGDSHGWKPRAYVDSFRESRTYLSAFGPYDRPRFEQWFSLVGQGTYVGFLPGKKELFARLGRTGFVAPDAVPEPFPASVDLNYWNSDKIYFSDASHLWQALMPQREFTELSLPAPGPIYGVANSSARSNSGRSEVSTLVVALESGLLVYDAKGALLTTLPYTRDVSRWGQVCFGFSADLDRFTMWYRPSMWIPWEKRRSIPSLVDEVDIHGKVLRSFTLPVIPSKPSKTALADLLKSRLQGPAFFFGNMAYQKIGAALGSPRMQENLNGYFGNAWPRTRETSQWILSISVILSVLTLLWARSVCFSWSRAVAWAVFVLAFGLAGLLAFRLASDWPYFVRCTACPKRRPVDHAACPHCEAGWPEPEATGVEIFEEAAR